MNKPQKYPQQGLTLIELMIAMVLGLVLTAGVIGVFIANQTTYRVNEALSGMQENARIAFQLMARDIRNAGFSGCINNGVVVNVLNSPGNQWWTNWQANQAGVLGYTAATAPAGLGNPVPVDNSEAIQLMFGGNTGISIQNHLPNTADLFVNSAVHGFQAGDIAMICDDNHSAIVQLSGVNGQTLTYGVLAGQAPGNSAPVPGIVPGLGIPDTGVAGSMQYRFGNNSMLIRFEAAAWYVGVVDGVRSLYRSTPRRTGANMVLTTDEMLRGVELLTFRYLERTSTDLRAANAVVVWADVVAVEVQLLMSAPANVQLAEDSRVFSYMINLRNR